MDNTKGNHVVIICKSCYGYGTIVKTEITDYHKGEYDTIQEICKSCNGSGRLFETTKVTTVPFSPLLVSEEDELDE